MLFTIVIAIIYIVSSIIGSVRIHIIITANICIYMSILYRHVYIPCIFVSCNVKMYTYTYIAFVIRSLPTLVS